jgi:RNA polymerase sigma-70 factor, ECF subfamily
MGRELMSSLFPAARFPALPLAKKQEAATEPIPRDEASADQPSDESLITKICADEAEALGILFNRYARLVWTIGRRILQNNEEADDLLQDVFLLVRRRAAVFDSSKGTVRSLLVQICYQRAFSRRRDLVRQNFYSSKKLPEDGSAAESPTTVLRYDEGLEAHFGRVALKEAFDDLSVEQRETLRLYFVEGYTFEEIAERMGQSYGNIRHHLYRGLDKLRKCLKGSGE